MTRTPILEWVILAACALTCVAALIYREWSLAIYLALLGGFAFTSRLARRAAYRAGYFMGRAEFLAQLQEGHARGLTLAETFEAIGEADIARAEDRRWPR